MAVGNQKAWNKNVAEAQQRELAEADGQRLVVEVGHPQHHGQLLLSVASFGHFHHDALALHSQEWSDENKEDVVEEQQHQEHTANHEVGQAQSLEHVDAEGDTQQVLQDP